MKKRIWSVLLTVCMVLSLLPTVAFADGRYEVLNTNDATGEDIIREARTWAGKAITYRSGSEPWPDSVAWRTGYDPSGYSFDCSGFVGRVLNDAGFRGASYQPYGQTVLSDHYGYNCIGISIEELINYGENIDDAVAKARNGDYSDLYPGDVLASLTGEMGRHVVFYAGLNDAGQPTMVEICDSETPYKDRVITPYYQRSFQYGARFADPIVDSGECGENVTWTLDGAGRLTISGTGPMDDYDNNRNLSPFNYNLSIQSVVIKPGVTSIGECVFTCCNNLTNVTIPDSVTSIGELAFDDCCSLTSVTIPNSVTSIECAAFYHCTSMTSIIIPDSVISIQACTFEECESLTSVIIPESITSIEDNAFEGCSSLTSVSIPDSVTSIGEDAFEDCSSLTSITIPDSVTSIGAAAFYECTSLTSISIPDSITIIDEVTFYGCRGLTSISIPDSVTSIGRSAFEYCSSLTSVTIPESVTSIDSYAFSDCSSLSDVYYSGSQDQWNEIDIEDYNDPLGNAVIHYNDVSAYFQMTSPQSQRAEVGETVSFNVGLKNKYPATVQWQYSKSTTDTWHNYNNAESVGSGDHDLYLLVTADAEHDGWFYRCVVTDERNHTLQSAPAVLALEKPLTTTPAENLVPVGATAKFTTDCTASSASYRWQCRTEGTEWRNVTSKNVGYRSATLSINAAAKLDGYQYRCVVTYADGTQAISTPATLRIQKVAITRQPKDYVGAVGSSAAFDLEATGDGLSYQWQYSDNGGKKWTNTTVKAATYTTKLNANRDGRLVRCIVKDANGFTVTSDAAAMRVSKLTITKQPVEQKAAMNSSVTFSVTASGEGLSYQWQYSDNSGKKWSNTTVKTSTYTTKLNANRDGRLVRCVITDKYGSTVTSSAARMTIVGPKITAQPKNYVGALGSTASFTVEAVGDGLTYQWQFSDNGGKKWSKSSVTSAEYNAKLTSAKDGRLVRCIVTDQNGNSVTSSSASMKIG